MGDGVYGAVPRDRMEAHVRKYRDFIDRVPGAPLFQKEFGYYCLDRWYEQGLSPDEDLSRLFGYDEPAVATIGGLGGCEAALEPAFEEELIEDRGAHELVRDRAGRSVLYFKGRRNGFMPEYVDHPVKDFYSFESEILWRMDPKSPARYDAMRGYLPPAIEKARRGYVIEQYVVGGYMYLRSLIGPEALLLAFYDDPKLIHACMEAWFRLADAIIAAHQASISLDFILLDEDICYNHGPLISPDMIGEFLSPYYRQLIANARARRLDKGRPISYILATDGFSDPVIPIYADLGMTFLEPFEVASNCDVVRTGREYPELLIAGGIDKRVLVSSRDAIDRMVDRILPAMRARGGYLPTCDHGVPEEVSLDNYRYYRERASEFG